MPVDFTTKGTLQEAVSRKEYWRLIDRWGDWAASRLLQFVSTPLM